jgi:hypothetical protein
MQFTTIKLAAKNNNAHSITLQAAYNTAHVIGDVSGEITVFASVHNVDGQLVAACNTHSAADLQEFVTNFKAVKLCKSITAKALQQAHNIVKTQTANSIAQHLQKAHSKALNAL